MSGTTIIESVPQSDQFDPEHDAAQLVALSKGHTTATNAADYWARMADILTAYRAQGTSYYLPELPNSYEEWYEHSTPALPFDEDELRANLRALSGLITKAHTIAAIYTREAARLDDDYAAVAPD